MAAGGIDRRLTRALLEEILESAPLLDLAPDGAMPWPAVVDRILSNVVELERVRTTRHGEIVRLTFVIPPDGVVDAPIVD